MRRARSPLIWLVPSFFSTRLPGTRHAAFATAAVACAVACIRAALVIPAAQGTKTGASRRPARLGSAVRGVPSPAADLRAGLRRSQQPGGTAVRTILLPHRRAAGGRHLLRAVGRSEEHTSELQSL